LAAGAIRESVSSDFNGLRRHFRAGGLLFLSPPSTPKPRSHVADEKREPGLPTFLKNNNERQVVCQEIVDFY
jgi:hypothetical protein